jgi:hypothetical protein
VVEKAIVTGQTFRMTKLGQMKRRWMLGSAIVGAAVVVLAATSTQALIARLTSIPLGRGTATITWSGSTGATPTINSIKGTAGGYVVSATGQIPKPSSISGTASTVPTEYPIADVKGTIGGTDFTVDIVLTLPSSLTSSAHQNVGHVTGTFRNQPVTGTLTASVDSDTFAFTGTIGVRHIHGTVSKPIHHGHGETAHASFTVTKQ